MQWLGIQINTRSLLVRDADRFEHAVQRAERKEIHKRRFIIGGS